MLRDHCAGERDYSFALWAVWVLARWSARRDLAEPVAAGAGAAPALY